MLYGASGRVCNASVEMLNPKCHLLQSTNWAYAVICSLLLPMQKEDNLICDSTWTNYLMVLGMWMCTCLVKKLMIDTSLWLKQQTTRRAGAMNIHINHHAQRMNSRRPSINSKSAIIFFAPKCTITCGTQQFLSWYQSVLQVYMMLESIDRTEILWPSQHWTII